MDNNIRRHNSPEELAGISQINLAVGVIESGETKFWRVILEKKYASSDNTTVPVASNSFVELL